MNNPKASTVRTIPRRQTLLALGGAGASLISLGTPAQTADTFACVLAPQMTEGPYWVDENLNRSDIRVDPSDGKTKPGVLLNLSITLHSVNGTSCALLPGAYVDIWHCDASGLYSDEQANNTVGKKFLRGYQISDDSGVVKFTTIYPGWYNGRTVHIHLRIRTYSGTIALDQFTSQLFFDDAITDEVFAQAPYSSRRSRDTRNSNDMVLNQMNNTSLTMLALTKGSDSYSASVDVGVNMKTATVSRPVITSGGVVNAASYQAGIVPQGWTTLFGQNLAASERVLQASDISAGIMPTTLSGVTVLVNNKPAFIQYVSAKQINFQAPADTGTGAVAVTVTNSSGISDAVTANLQTIQLGLFASQGYVAAVRPDGTIITGSASSGPGTSAAKPGETIQIYGTGFGPTSPEVAPGIVYQGSAPLTSPATMIVGGTAIVATYAGLVGTGLYQVNFVVPALADGDHEVQIEIAGLRSQSGVLLKVQS